MPDTILILLSRKETCLLQTFIYHVTTQIDIAMAKSKLQRVFHFAHTFRSRHHVIWLMKRNNNIMFATAIFYHSLHLPYKVSCIFESTILPNKEHIAPGSSQLSHRLRLYYTTLAERISLLNLLLRCQEIIKLKFKFLVWILPKLGLGFKHDCFAINKNWVYSGTCVLFKATLQERKDLTLMVIGRNKCRNVVITYKGIKLSFTIIEEHHIMCQQHWISTLSCHDGKRILTANSTVYDIIVISHKVLQHSWVTIIPLYPTFDHTFIPSAISMASG